jgi:hypothetical protein
MTTKKCLKKTVRGWFPKEPFKIYTTKPFKPRWKRPVWVALTLVTVVALGFAVYAGVQTYLRYSDPRLDVTSAYFEKSLNCTTAQVGDFVEVTVQVGWHGYLLPEFKREVRVVDQFPEDRFSLVGGSNIFEYTGYGGSPQFTYTLKVISEKNDAELQEPKIYLDNVEITLTGKTQIPE